MNAKELAKTLDGIWYPVRIDTEIISKAKENDLVIVFGSSDDLIEFRGAIHDEYGVFDGGTVLVDSAGLVDYENFENINLIDKSDRDWVRTELNREVSARTVTAVWAENGYSWIYKTDIPHETFEVIEPADDYGGEEKYCKGIVFSLSDL